MPYRRLPNTDNARIRALRTAIEQSRAHPHQRVIQSEISKLQTLLRNFERAQTLYQSTLQVQVNASRKMQTLVKNARLYVSHFIQVLNFCILRKEIKSSAKLHYGLEPEDQTVPDLTSNESLLHWGELIIQGEQKRLKEGGTPIYNPSIARVNVDFSLFKNAYISQKMHQNNTTRQLEAVSSQRDEIDVELCEIWNQVEAFFDNLPRADKLERCKEYGVVYYTRKKEKKGRIESEDY